MNRRTLLKNLSISAAAVSFPAWANAWTKESLPKVGSISKTQETILADLVDVIIPRTDTPGAIDVGADQFVQAYAATMFTEKEQAQFMEALEEVDAVAKAKYAKGFANLSAADKKSCLEAIASGEDGELKKAIEQVKNLTIQGFTRSEWYMTEIEGYTMAPGFYHGCVPM
ncbi:gluconate 2-dehydrogenase subunit 3 family protein [Marinilongibacter aquaticus]|uniref:gluconate 2-dehydrogenase subunit 3 family protein n=1 Tax=Marinilongibacter aquaticus TaxID=2975157 RepID=UPI0021BDAA46|nr:gluconate 2-dehydrogenase subunit 3 family protein [Marinilongibacter aquaticus]UBM57329.1 gluconate 2-dehydrogenase subunit 3 family protein [Marinilongibacter aquaticus]